MKLIRNIIQFMKFLFPFTETLRNCVVKDEIGKLNTIPEVIFTIMAVKNKINYKLNSLT